MERFTTLSVVVGCTPGSTSTPVLGKAASQPLRSRLRRRRDSDATGLAQGNELAFSGHVGPMMRYAIPPNAAVVALSASRSSQTCSRRHFGKIRTGPTCSWCCRDSVDRPFPNC
jgi:hypothetical protein